MRKGGAGGRGRFREKGAAGHGSTARGLDKAEGAVRAGPAAGGRRALGAAGQGEGGSEAGRWVFREIWL